MRAEIKALHQRLGSTIVYVTHDQIEAMTMADRIVVLRSGNVEQIGTPMELFDYPKNIFVAGFLGSPAMNFLPGRLAADGSAALVLSNGESVALARRPEVCGDNDIVLGVRPQDITQDPDNGTAAIVKVIEPTGADTHVLVELAGQEVTCVLDARLDMKPGDQIRLSFRTPAVHFFDAKTEARLQAVSNQDEGLEA
jgi:multiple sugar transport system ATP-binding protein